MMHFLHMEWPQLSSSGSVKSSLHRGQVDTRTAEAVEPEDELGVTAAISKVLKRGCQKRTIAKWKIMETHSRAA